MPAATRRLATPGPGVCHRRPAVGRKTRRARLAGTRGPRAPPPVSRTAARPRMAARIATGQLLLRA
eukprot:1449441-Alexandrium_andersonii.AAC.1